MDDERSASEIKRVEGLIQDALAWMVTESPLYASLMMSFRCEVDASLGVGTSVLAWTDGRSIRVCPSKLVDARMIVPLLAHELNHIFFHATRNFLREYKNDKLVREACEVEADMHIPLSFGQVVPESGRSVLVGYLRDHGVVTFEKIYLWLAAQEEREKAEGEGKLEGNSELLCEANGWGTDEFDPIGGTEEARVEIVERVLRAVEGNRIIGSLSNAHAIHLDKLRSPRLNWKQLLRSLWKSKVGPYDMDPTRISTTYLRLGLKLPPIGRVPGAPDVVLVVDCSGSMLGNPLKLVLSEIRGLAGLVSDVDILFVDTEIVRAVCLKEVTDAEVFGLAGTLVGGGGTDFRPAFEWVQQERRTPSLLVYLTDLWGIYPDRAPRYDVLWVVPHDEELVVPFGRVVHIPQKDMTS